MYLLVMNRRIREGELESGAEDQTEEVLEELENGKMLPAIDSNLPAPSVTVQPTAVPAAPVKAPPPLPPTGLPEGWTLDQWNHFGWQYVESMKK
jgi:hypothetical protein